MKDYLSYYLSYYHTAYEYCIMQNWVKETVSLA